MEIFPIYDRSVSRDSKEKLLNQRSQLFWLTGLSGSGKSTLAIALEKKWTETGRAVVLLDGDNVRDGLCGDLGFEEAHRMENIRRIAEVGRIMVQQGLIVLCAFVSPQKQLREKAKEIIGKSDFHLIYIKASIETCRKRDPKGLYEKAVEGKIDNFTGISAPFDVPQNADLVIDTEKHTIDENLNSLLNYTNKFIQL